MAELSEQDQPGHKRGRAWCFTLNNYTTGDWNFIRAALKDCVYGVVGKEVGESGTPHLQGFVYFEAAKTYSAVKKFFRAPSMHVEGMQGTFKEASEYCMKDGDFFESGRLMHILFYASE